MAQNTPPRAGRGRQKKDVFACHRPTHRAQSLSAIDVDALRRAEIRVVLLDMDNTLSTLNGQALAPDAQQFVNDLHAAGMRLAVFSNNQPGNVRRLADQLSIDQAIARAGKPSRKAFVRAADRMGQPPRHCAVVGDQLMTDIVGANKAGFGATVLVKPLAKKEWFFTKFNRIREAIILRISHQAPNR